MKHLVLLVFCSFLGGTGFAQSFYESPHVKDGKTMTFRLPDGYYEVANSVSYGNAVFAPAPDLDINDLDIESLEFGVLAVSHEVFIEGGLEEFVEEMRGEIMDMGETAIVIDEPHIEQVNGRSCLLTAISGIVNEEVKMDAMYISATTFGDYMIVVYYMANEKRPENLTYEDFKKISASAREITTEREDEMMTFEDEMEEEYVTNFINDLYETDITYYDILPDFGEFWDETMDENSHLLAEFIYKEDMGNIAVFSGGDVTNYPSKTEMAKAIQLVFDLSTPPTIKDEASFSNEDHDFNVFTISGAGALVGLYTTIVSEELVFFVVVNADPASAEFKPAARDFMINMWVDSEVWSEDE
jgi:hypothetical protein